MQWLINYLRGFVSVTVWGAFPERLLNLCAANRLGFWGLEWVDETTFRFTVPFREYARLEKLAQKAMCELRAPRRAGLPVLAMDLRRRWAFLTGMGLCVLALCVLSQVVLTVDVEGNETVSTAVILDELSRLGLRPGVFGPLLEEEEISNAALIELEELSFLSVNLYGCRAQVQVKEAEEAPDRPDKTIPADLVSAAGGIVTQVTATAGQALVQEGDTVVKGDVLITGFMDLPEISEAEADAGMYVVRASGQAWARTWRTLKAQIPLTARVKAYTGASKTRFALDFFGQRVNFYQNSGISYARYDKIVKVKTLSLPGGGVLPISLIQETAREYETQPVQLDRDAAAALLERDLRGELDEILKQTDGACFRSDCAAAVEGDVLVVTLLAECSEQIAKTVEREGKTGYVRAGVS